MDDAVDDQERFSALFRSTVPRVAGYVRRHVSVDDVDDVLSETYLIAWRRRDRIDTDDPIPWLLVTARHVIANRGRRRSRSELLVTDTDALAAALLHHDAADGAVLDRETALAALVALSPVEREAVLLVAWDGLRNADAATVAGCSTRAFTVRLHRARLHLKRYLSPDLLSAPRNAVHTVKEQR
jgi:RNA polymerase sigma factor (sigma-70 family)